MSGKNNVTSYSNVQGNIISGNTNTSATSTSPGELQNNIISGN